MLGPQILFVIQSPDVFKSPASDTYIIFGEVSVGYRRGLGSSNGYPVLLPHAREAKLIGCRVRATNAWCVVNPTVMALVVHCTCWLVLLLPAR